MQLEGGTDIIGFLSWVDKEPRNTACPQNHQILFKRR